VTLERDSIADSQARKLLAKPFCFGRICRFLETVSEFKRRYSPLFVRHDRIRSLKRRRLA
jgi:hypothetical protein